MELKYVKSFIVIKLSFVFLLSGISLLFSGCATFITKSSSHSSFSGQSNCLVEMGVKNRKILANEGNIYLQLLFYRRTLVLLRIKNNLNNKDSVI